MILSYEKRKNFLVNFLEVLIKAPLKLGLNSAILILLAFILIRPAHDLAEGAYQAVNFITRVRAWIPSLGAVIPSVKTEIKQTAYKGLSKEQSAVVRDIIQAGRDMNMSDKDIKLALMAASQESTLRNLSFSICFLFLLVTIGILQRQEEVNQIALELFSKDLRDGDRLSVE